MHVRARFDLPVRWDGGKGTLVNLSFRGLGVETLSPQAAGTTLELFRFEKDSGEPVPCQVKWSHRRGGNYFMGLSFEGAEGSWLEPVLTEPGLDGSQRRQYVRAEAGIPANILGRASRLWGTGETIDLGLGGAVVEIAARVMPQTTVAVELGPFGRLKQLKLIGVVLGVETHGDNHRHRIQFKDVNADQRKQLSRFVKHSLKQ